MSAQLALELITTMMLRDDLAECVAYVNQRLDEELLSQDDAYSLIGILAGLASGAIRAWAEDTDREPEDLLRTIALAHASEDDTDEDDD